MSVAAPAARLIADGPGRARVEGALDFDSVGPLLAAGDAMLEPDGRLLIDLAAVGSANSAGLALLLEWVDLARSRDTDLSYLNLPDPLRRIAAISNIEPLLAAAHRPAEATTHG
jgi:phospholipid transport system transporter-binding protein